MQDFLKNHLRLLSQDTYEKIIFFHRFYVSFLLVTFIFFLFNNDDD